MRSDLILIRSEHLQASFGHGDRVGAHATAGILDFLETGGGKTCSTIGCHRFTGSLFEQRLGEIHIQAELKLLRGAATQRT